MLQHLASDEEKTRIVSFQFLDNKSAILFLFFFSSFCVEYQPSLTPQPRYVTISHSSPGEEGFPQPLLFSFSLAFGCQERALSVLQRRAPMGLELSVPGEASPFNLRFNIRKLYT